ncbi:unnamed protein product [Cuscuta europaea]|uniref:Uncharacterized protein n=1 Tax=Cuscuta europaea TaxID=41803 RepID=A0A9P0ZGA0_CUSEU|nr:unnamed protein product [Cuscuta europaea]
MKNNQNISSVPETAATATSAQNRSSIPAPPLKVSYAATLSSTAADKATIITTTPAQPLNAGRTVNSRGTYSYKQPRTDTNHHTRSFAEILKQPNPSFPLKQPSRLNGMPTVSFSEEEIVSLAKEMNFALIGTFLHGIPKLAMVRSTFN